VICKGLSSRSKAWFKLPIVLRAAPCQDLYLNFSEKLPIEEWFIPREDSQPTLLLMWQNPAPEDMTSWVFQQFTSNFSYPNWCRPDFLYQQGMSWAAERSVLPTTSISNGCWPSPVPQGICRTLRQERGCHWWYQKVPCSNPYKLRAFPNPHFI